MTYKIEVIILPVSDVDRALAFYAEQAGFSLDVEVGDVRHKSPIDDWRGDWEPGLDPNRRAYASLADFTDPDGNQWVLQEAAPTTQSSRRGRQAGHLRGDR